MESMGRKFKRERSERITQIALQLALIMEENISAYNWGDYIIVTRDMMWDDLSKRNLLPEGSELRCCALKSLWAIAMEKIDKYSTENT